MVRKNEINHFIKTRPLFLFLLPLFFILHGFVRNYSSVPVGEALSLMLTYMIGMLMVTAFFWLIYRSVIKAGLFAFLITAYYFFFGSLQDMIRVHLPGIFLHYRVIMTLSFIFFLVLFLWLKRRKRSLSMVTCYLNLLLSLFVLLDAGWLIAKVSRAGISHHTTSEFKRCDTCKRPDIYFIVPDQYTGKAALREVFQFDNTSFENQLEQRGFFIAKESSSNYNLTPFSIASTLNMDYLDLQKGPQNYETVGYSYRIIRNSRIIKFVDSYNYQFYNCSIFDFDGKPANKYSNFLPYGTELITSQTLAGRVETDFQPDVLAGKFGRTLQKKVAYRYLRFNETIFAMTQKIASRHTAAPKFVYTHFMMPHYPYYFDSKGRPMPLEKFTGIKNENSSDYIEYLQYTNKKILQLIDHILAVSPEPPVIIILGDHGFRHPKIKTDRKYDFMNLNAVYFPDKNYTGLYDTITNVNQFRVVLNTLFKQSFLLLKDSSTNVRD